MKLIDRFHNLEGQTIKKFYEHYEPGGLFLFESDDFAIFKYDDYHGLWRLGKMSDVNEYLEEYLSEDGIVISGEILEHINELKRVGEFRELRDHIANKIRLERKVNNFDYWLIEENMNLFTDPSQHLEEIIDKVIKGSLNDNSYIE